MTSCRASAALIPDGVKSMYTSHVKKKTRPSESSITCELKSIIATSTRVFFIIDAFDERSVSDGLVSVRQPFLHQLVSLSVQTGISILAISRPNTEIAAYLQTYVSVEIKPRREDIQSYLDSRIVELPDFVQQRPNLKQCIKSCSWDISISRAGQKCTTNIAKVSSRSTLLQFTPRSGEREEGSKYDN